MVQNVFPNLFSTIQVQGLSIRNRIVMPPMSTNFGDPANLGAVTPRHNAYYRQRAKGGAGLIIVEATASTPSPGFRGLGLGLFDDRFISGLSELALAIRAEGAACGIQIIPTGAGRIGAMKVDCEGNPDKSSLNVNEYFAVSPLPHPMHGVVARELTAGQIDKIAGDIADAARRARQAGFDVVEIHGAHGYLLHEFVSPLTNRRTDIYGGDIEGRTRFPLDVVKKVKAAIDNDTVLSYRVSATEFAEGGLDIEEVIIFVKKLQEAGINMIHVSGGTNETPVAMNRVIPPMSYPRGRLVPYAQMIKEAVSIPVIAVQRINTPELAEEIIREGKADLVATGRALIADPYWPLKAREGRISEIRRCVACNQGCMEQIVLGKSLSCLYNPEVGREELNESDKKTQTRKRILVVGGGPAGMEAACVLAEKGHHVRLVEKEDSLGGAAKIASILDEKKEFGAVIEYLKNRIQRLGIDVRLGNSFDMVDSWNDNFDEVIISTGAIPIEPRKEWMGNKYRICFAKDALSELDTVGRKVFIIGGGSVGIEVAEFLCKLEREITVIEMCNRICSDLGPLNYVDVAERVSKKPITVMLNTAFLALTDKGVKILRNGKEEHLDAPDTVVIAMGAKPAPLIVGDRQIPVHYIGDCAKAGNAMDAIHQAFNIARDM
jgi:2,4-dienoyl-CoA reductase-like NADH-dependent reductase (Old Yellow Enzyme family)/thioredoxin reductase